MRPTIVRTDRRYFVYLVGFLGAIGILDTALLNPTIAAYAKFLGADDFLSSFIAGMYSIVAIPASLVMGLMIDVIGRKRALVTGLGLTALWIYGYFVASTPMHLLLFRVTHSLSGSLVFPATIAMAVDTARKGIGRGLGAYWMVIGGALAIGSFVSAAMVRSLGFRPIFLLVVGISLLGMAIALTLPETARSRFKPKASLGILASSMRWLSVSYVSIFSLYFAFGVIVGSLSLVIIALGVSEQEAASRVGVYIGLAIVVSLPLFYVTGRILNRVGPVRILAAGIVLTAFSQLLLMWSLEAPYAYASSALLGISIAFVFVASTAVASVPEARGASIGLHQTANIAGVAVGAPVSGLLLKYFGGVSPFLVALAVQWLTLMFIAASRKVTKAAELGLLEAQG